VKNELSANPKEVFSALYKIFLDKDSGPQAGWFLGSLEKDFVIGRLKEANEQ
jgi:lysyl-tRNA synthetase class 1